MKRKTNTLPLIISIILAAAAVVLILLSIFGDFKTNWVLNAGLACAALGCFINVINIIKNKK